MKDVLLHQEPAYRNGICPVDLQQMNRCTSRRRLGNQSSTIPGEMLVPLLPSWMKQRNDLIRDRVDARQVRPLVAVAVAARESQVFQHGGTTVLLGDDVVELKRQFSERFRETTILAAVTGPDADGFVNRFVHWRA